MHEEECERRKGMEQRREGTNGRWMQRRTVLFWLAADVSIRKTSARECLKLIINLRAMLSQND